MDKASAYREQAAQAKIEELLEELKAFQIRYDEIKEEMRVLRERYDRKHRNSSRHEAGTVFLYVSYAVAVMGLAIGLGYNAHPLVGLFVIAAGLATIGFHLRTP